MDKDKKVSQLEDSGASLVEYAMVVLVLSIVMIAALKAVSSGSSQNFSAVESELTV